MYFMLAAAVDRFVYLKVGLAAVLVLIGGTIMALLWKTRRA